MAQQRRWKNSVLSGHLLTSYGTQLVGKLTNLRGMEAADILPQQNLAAKPQQWS
ncbi:protein of unknown function [Paenibacillus alvei]|uniref:Uncharacterized protein n=1 Tax=Paenibacillus alvei TaxID=44250 RepID=A0A383RL07_PAEAL|nr:protein of unknown function [Paenibacillus alvei]